MTKAAFSTLGCPDGRLGQRKAAVQYWIEVEDADPGRQPLALTADIYPTFMHVKAKF